MKNRKTTLLVASLGLQATLMVLTIVSMISKGPDLLLITLACLTALGMVFQAVALVKPDIG